MLHRLLRDLTIFLAAAISVVTATTAGVVDFAVTSLGGSSWRYDYTINNPTPSAGFDELTVYFDYSKYSNLVTDVISDRVPLFEKSSIDEFYVDMTGMDRFFNCSLFTRELKNKLYKELDCQFRNSISSLNLFLIYNFGIYLSCFQVAMTQELRDRIYISIH